MPLITTTAALEAACQRLGTHDFVTIDTEFMRENSYWPDLCLVQVADSHEAAAIDPKAPGIDLTPLLNLLVDNEDVLKVFHAGGQDIEIVHNLTGKAPHPMFDTQIAAMAAGFGEQFIDDVRSGLSVVPIAVGRDEREYDGDCPRREEERGDVPSEPHAAELPGV